MALAWTSRFGKDIEKRSFLAPNSTNCETENEPKGLETLTGDRIIALVNGLLQYGIIHDRNNIPFYEIENLGVIWDGQIDPQITHLSRRNSMVLDRHFSIGQRVIFGEICGTVIGSSETYSLQIQNSNHLILSDSPVNSLKPLTKLFHGVFIEYMGWFGQISEVLRRVKVEFEPNVVCEVLRREPVVTKALISDRPKKKKERRKKRLLNRNYPFIINPAFPTNDVPVNGASIKFTGRNLYNIANSLGLCITTTSLTGKVISSDVVDIAVDWFTNIPGLPETPRPKMSLGQDEISKIHQFYIHPCRHFFKDGLCEYELQPTDDLIHVGEFKQRLTTVLESGNPDDIETSEKRHKFESLDLQVGSKLIVHKHILRHQFEILDEKTEEVHTVYGCDLWPCSDDIFQREKQFQPPQFVRMKYCYEPEDEFKYGVVLHYLTVCAFNPRVVFAVQWLKEVNGEIETLEIHEESFMENMVVHKEYNELSIGTHVSRAVGFTDTDNNGFQFGTILSIDRYRNGTINVYCATDMTEKRMWPFQLQRILYEQPGPNMKRVDGKFMCSDIPRICRGPDHRAILVNPFQEDQCFIYKSLQLGSHDYSDVDSDSDSESDEDFDREEPPPPSDAATSNPTDTNTNPVQLPDSSGTGDESSQ